MTLTRSSKQSQNRVELLVLAGLSGLLYSSWPLAYVLNPTGNRGLASNLEGLGQPYNWLFALLDISSGVLVLAVAWLVLVGRKKSMSRLAQFSVLAYGGFGVLTAIDAILPEDCLADQHQCGSLLQHPLVILHGLVSLASIGCLTLSLLGVWWLVYRRRHSQMRLSSMLSVVLIIWFFFGLNTAYLLALDRSSTLSQHIFIIACSIWTGAFPLLIHRLNLSSGVVEAAARIRTSRHPVTLRAKSRLGV